MNKGKALRVIDEYNTLSIDMIFNEDSTLLTFFELHENEEDLKNAIQKYCQQSSLSMGRPDAVDTSKQGDMSDLNDVGLLVYK